MTKIHYNCAQKVLLAFADKCKVGDGLVAEFKKYGGGRATNNECGALFSAKYLLGDNGCAIKSIEQDFAQLAGETRCKLIRSLNKVPCDGCVRIAVDLLKKHIDG